MSFYYINVEKIGKCKNVKKNKIKKYASPANEFLLHTAGAIENPKTKFILKNV